MASTKLPPLTHAPGENTAKPIRSYLTWLTSSASLLIVLLVAFSLFFTAYTLQKHAAFQTAGYDLGNHDQAMWSTLQGRPLAITTMPDIASRWQLHFEPTLLLLLPIYAVAPAPTTLLVAQVLIVAAGALPIFWLARQRLDSVAAGLVFAAVYLLFPALQGGLVFDFHAVSLATTLLSFGLYFVFTRRYRLALGLLILAMGTKEDIPLVVLLVGGYMVVAQRQRAWGVAVAGLALAWFIVANFVIIPAVSPAGDNIHISRYALWGDSMGQVVQTVLLRPHEVAGYMFSGDRLFYWIRVLIPVAFTALLSPLTLAMALPVMAINTLSAYPPNYQLDRFHYSMVLVPFIVAASINGVANLIAWTAPKLKHVRPGFLKHTLLVMIVIVTLAYQVQFGHTPIGRYFDWPPVTSHHHRVEVLLARIPAEAAVAAQNNLVPHLSRREFIFTLPKMAHEGRQADYLFFDLTADLYPYASIPAYCDHLDQLVRADDYGLIVAADALLLFKRGAESAAPATLVDSCG